MEHDGERRRCIDTAADTGDVLAPVDEDDACEVRRFALLRADDRAIIGGSRRGRVVGHAVTSLCSGLMCGCQCSGAKPPGFFNCGIELRCIPCPGLRQIRTATSATSRGLRNFANKVPSVNAARHEVGRDGHNEGWLAVHVRAEHHDGRFQRSRTRSATSLRASVLRDIKSSHRQVGVTVL